MQNSINTRLSVRNLAGCRYRDTCRNGQKGALMIVLIVALVVLSALSGGLVYIFSSSTLNPVSGMYTQRAYYNAEAGLRYMKANYVWAVDKLVLSSQTLTLPGGGTANVTVTGLTGTFVPATATVTASSGSTITISGTFPSASQSLPQFFKRDDGSNTIYRYTGISGAILSGVYPAFSFTSGGITTVASATITSKGTFKNVSRTITSIWPVTDSVEKPNGETTLNVNNWEISPYTELPADILAQVSNALSTIASWFHIDIAALTPMQILQWMADIPGWLLYPAPDCAGGRSSWSYYSWGNFQEASIDGNEAIQTNVYANRFFLRYLPNGDGNFYNDAWVHGGQKLSYDAQAKIKVGGLLSRQYLVGLSVRADSHSNSQLFNPVAVDQFGISYAMGHNNQFRLPTDNDPYIVFWRSVGNSFKLIAYKKLTDAEGAVVEDIYFSDDMSSIENGWTHPINTHCASCGWTVAASDRGQSRNGYLIWTSGDSILVGFYPWIILQRTFIDNPIPASVPAATLSFWYKKRTVAPTSWRNWIPAEVRIAPVGIADGAGGKINGSEFTPTDTWQQMLISLDNTQLNFIRAGGRIQFFVQTPPGSILTLTTCPPGSPCSADFLIDDVVIKSIKLADWATLGVRVRETSSPSRSNEFEIFYGSTAPNGTTSRTTSLDINRAAYPRFADGITVANWLPQSPINTITTTTDDKFTLVSSDPNTSTATANPWYWWYDSDGNYTTAANGASYPTSSARITEDNCSYTLTTSGGGSLETNAVIKTSGINCRTTDTMSYTACTDEFALHVYSPNTYNTFFDDIFVQTTAGTPLYNPGIQY